MHNYAKGEPKLTEENLHIGFLPNSHLPPGFPRTISLRIAAKWLNELCFHPTHYHKGLCIDGYERQDVVDNRKLYLRKIEIIECSHLSPPLCLDEDIIGNISAQRKLILLFHDESCFHANEGPSWGKLKVRPKSVGRGIMVSVFFPRYMMVVIDR